VTNLGSDVWSRVLTQLDNPSVGSVAEATADSFDLNISDAYDGVKKALTERTLTEEDTGGAFSTVRLATDNETTETPKTDVHKSEESGNGARTTEQAAAIRTPRHRSTRKIAQRLIARLPAAGSNSISVTQTSVSRKTPKAAALTSVLSFLPSVPTGWKTGSHSSTGMTSATPRPARSTPSRSSTSAGSVGTSRFRPPARVSTDV